MSAPIIRDATEADLGAIFDLVLELAEYENGLEKVSATVESYRDAFAHDYFRALVATLDDEVVGIAVYYKTFSTWKGRMMHLEDFVVREQYRRLGVGKLLFDAFVEKAHAANSVMCKWQVLHWNEPAINFYKKYDATFDEEWVDVKLYF